MSYYLIKDLNVLGKIEGYLPYLYDASEGWVLDENNILMDRFIGYDGEEIGCMSMLQLIDEISEEEARTLMDEINKASHEAQS